jgi:hypothetical protein
MNKEKEKTKELVTIDFGGFYETLADEAIKQRMFNEYGNINKYESYDDQPWEVIEKYETQENLNKAYDDYCIDYCEYLQKWISKNLNVEISIQFSELWSPREYNYQTDQIDAHISIKDLNKLYEAIRSNKEFCKEFIETIEKNTTSCDGYMAFYNKDQVLNENKHNMLFRNIFDFICSKVDEIHCYYEIVEGY